MHHTVDMDMASDLEGTNIHLRWGKKHSYFSLNFQWSICKVK